MENKSYLAQLSDKEIDNMLQQLGYEKLTDIKNRKGKYVPAVRKSWNAQDNEFVMFINCRKSAKQELSLKSLKDNPIIKGSAALSAMVQNLNKSLGDYDSSSTTLMLTDFGIYTLEIFYNDEKEEQYKTELHYKYVDYMIEKYGNEYVEAYNNNIDRKVAQEKEERDRNNQDQNSLTLKK